MIQMEELNTFFQQFFGDDSLNISRATTADDVDTWDSLVHMNLVAALEKKYKIRFALGELETLQNVGDMFDMINSKISN